MLVFVSFLRLLIQEFPELADPQNRQDAIQEWHLLEASSPGGVAPSDARLALGWLSYNLGLRTRKPRRPRPCPTPGNGLERGTFLADLSDELEVALSLEIRAA